MPTPRLTDPAAAAAVLRAGGLVAFPTETVYGLGANAFDADAVARVFAAKGRPADNPLIVHLAHADDADALAVVSGTARRLMDAFWPGPLTLVLPLRTVDDADGLPVAPRLADALTAGLGTVALRVPALPLARAFLAACGVPVAAPSANRSGRPSPTDAGAVLDDLDGRIDAVLDGPPADSGLESTVVDVTSPVPLVLRPGAVSLDDLRRIVAETTDVTAADDRARRSPGTRHRHYAPHARVVLASPNRPLPDLAGPSGWMGLGAPPAPHRFARVWTFASVEDYARALYRTFRAADALGLATLVCEAPPAAHGLAPALLDRLRRAADASPSSPPPR